MKPNRCFTSSCCMLWWDLSRSFHLFFCCVCAVSMYPAFSVQPHKVFASSKIHHDIMLLSYPQSLIFGFFHLQQGGECMHQAGAGCHYAESRPVFRSRQGLPHWWFTGHPFWDVWPPPDLWWGWGKPFLISPPQKWSLVIQHNIKRNCFPFLFWTSLTAFIRNADKPSSDMCFNLSIGLSSSLIEDDGITEWEWNHLSGCNQTQKPILRQKHDSAEIKKRIPVLE